MPPKKRRAGSTSDKELNEQLMDACLRLDVQGVKSIIGRGAEPAAVRVPTPFSKGDRLSPMAAVLLQGSLSPPALDVLHLLLAHGASLEDMMDLPGSGFPPPAGPTVLDGGRGGSNTAGRVSPSVETPAAAAAGNSSRRKSRHSSLGSARSEEIPMEISAPVAAAATGVERGTLLHYVVALGDHAHLLQLLLLAGFPREVLPQSLLPQIETEIVAPAKAPLPIRADSRTGSRQGGRLRTPSLARQSSRLSRMKANEARESDGRGPRSALPPLSAIPLSGGERLRRKTTDAEGRETVEEVRFDYTVRTSSSGLTPLELAIERGDVTSARLLSFYGAICDHRVPVNGRQTALARACVVGDLAQVERLLDCGASMSEISADGRYTLVHYALAQPHILDYLLRRGLPIDVENAQGESALVSLIRWGTGRNADLLSRDSSNPLHSATITKLAALPPAVVRNYILVPPPPSMWAPTVKSKSISTSARGAAKQFAARESGPLPGVEEYKNVIGGGEMGTWWSFTSLPTAEMIQTLLERGASVNGEDTPLAPYPLPEGSGGEFPRLGELGSSAQPLFSSMSFGPAVSLPLSFSTDGRFGPGGVPNMPARFTLGYPPLRLTPLMHAIVGYHPELIRRLVVEHKADIMARDAQGACALHYAALCVHPSVMELLLSPLVWSAASNFDVNAVDAAGRTALHYAASQGNAEVVQQLLSLGPALFAGRPDYRGRTALHLAVRANETRVVELLLRHSETLMGSIPAMTMLPSSSSRRKPRATRTNHGTRYTGAGQTAVPEFVIVDVEAEDAEERATALEMAVKYHRDPVLVRALLLEGRASMQRPSGLENGGTLIHRAVVDSRTAYVRAMLESYADVNEPDEEDKTPLYLAVDCSAPNLELISCLLASGALPDVPSFTTLATPLHVAARRGRSDVLAALFHRVGHRTRDAMFQRQSTLSTGGAPAPRRPHRTSRSSRSDLFARGGSHTADREVDSGSFQSLAAAEETVGHDEYDPGNASAGSSGSRHLPEGAALRPRPLLPAAQLRVVDASARTLLHVLCAHSDAAQQRRVMPLIKELLQSDVGETLSEAVDAHGRTALHEACRADFSEAVEMLLSIDLRLVLYVDSSGRTPLHDCMSAYRGAAQSEPVELGGVHASHPFLHDPLPTGGPIHFRVVDVDGTPGKRKDGTGRNCISAVVEAVRSVLPCQLRGAFSFSNRHGMVTQLTITSQLPRLRKRPWGSAPLVFGSAESPAIPYLGHGERNLASKEEVGWVRTIEDYLQLTDEAGCTPALVAGEAGNVEAGIELLRATGLASKAPLPYPCAASH